MIFANLQVTVFKAGQPSLLLLASFPFILRTMFGALRCNKDAHNDLEYVDLSGHNSVNAFKHTGLVSELFLPTAILIRKRKEVAKATDTRLVISAENKR